MKPKFKVGQKVRIVSPASVFQGKTYTVSRIEIDRLGAQYLVGSMWFSERELKKASNHDRR